MLAWNSANYLQKCLSSIFEDLSRSLLAFEVFVIDNGSRDQTREIIETFKARYPRQLHTTFLPQNVGTTVSRNLALKKARGEAIVVLDSDIEIVTPGTFQGLVDSLRGSPGTGLVAPRLVYNSGKLQKSIDRFPTLQSKFLRFFFLKSIEKWEAKNAAMQTPLEVDYAISAFWVIRGKILETVGLLDEQIFYAPEDVDFCLRIWQAGYKVVYFPTITCIHHAQEISRGLKFNKAMMQHFGGLIYYFRKHRYWFIPPRVTDAAE
jgi:GT2 family glycosyltransferase